MYTFSTYSEKEGGGVVVIQREGERGNRGEYRSQTWVKKPTKLKVLNKLVKLAISNL
jgi:hypothetical protein